MESRREVVSDKSEREFELTQAYRLCKGRASLRGVRLIQVLTCTFVASFHFFIKLLLIHGQDWIISNFQTLNGIRAVRSSHYDSTVHTNTQDIV